MSFDKCLLTLHAQDKLPVSDIRDAARQYRDDGMEYGEAMQRATQDHLDMARAQERKIVEAVRSAYVEQGGKLPERAAQVAEPGAKYRDQTETPEFKRWFSNSKVVDEQGRPLVVYHGTSEDFSSFDNGKAGKNFGDDSGLFFTSSPQNAAAYAGSDGANIMPSYLSLQNPLRIEFDGFNSDRQFFRRRAEIMADARQGGHDGVIAVDNDGNQTLVAFRPEQIKSATGNRGTFDPADANILHSRTADDLGIKSELLDHMDAAADERGMMKASDLADWVREQNAPGAAPLANWLDVMGDATVAKSSVMKYMEHSGNHLFSMYSGESGNDAWHKATKPQSIREQVEHHLGRELASVTPLKVMDAAVLSAIKNDQVRRAVVEAIPIDVVNILADHGIAPEELVSQPDMIAKRLPEVSRAPVARGLADALSLVGARLRAELRRVLSSEVAGGNREFDLAILARDLNPDVVVGLLSPGRAYGLDGNLTHPGFGGADARAELPVSRLQDAGESAEPTATELAGYLNRHSQLANGEEGDALANKYSVETGQMSRFDPKRRQMMAAAAAMAMHPQDAGNGVKLGRAKPIDAALLGEKIGTRAERLLRAGATSGEVNRGGMDALRTALQEIAIRGPHDLRALANQIERLLPPDGKLHLTIDDTATPNMNGSVKMSPDVHMTLHTADGRTGLTYETVLHEAMHVAVAARYRTLAAEARAAENIDGPRPMAAEALAQFHQVWGEFRDMAAGEKFGNADLEMAVHEAMRSPDEFFVRSLTDPKLQAYMAGRRYSGTTLWQRFKDWVKTNLFGMEKGGTAPSWLDAALSASNDLASAMHGDRADFSRVREGGDGTIKSADYRDEHTAPRRGEAAPLSDLTGDGMIYPDDVYKHGQRYYGTGNDALDRQAFRIANMAKGKPDFDVMIYRAVPSGVDAKINPGDWVAIVRGYAEDHGEGRFDGDYKIISKMVKAGDIFTNGDSIQEWGYQPEGDDALYSRRAAPPAPTPAEQEASEAKLAKMLKLPAKLVKSAAFETKMMVMPMTAGSEKAMAWAKDFANNNRVAGDQWKRFDKVLRENYSEDQLRKMWEAADQENDLRREGRTSTTAGLASLTPGERETVELLHQYGRELWRKALDAGLVQGEGVHYWTPRMAARFVADGGVEVLNKIGGDFSKEATNLRTSASSLKRRDYETTEESEAALKAKMGEDAAYVKNIRVMPLAMAQLERAIAGRTLVNQIKAHGQAAGESLILEHGEPGYITINHPALKVMRPRMKVEDGKTVPVKDEDGNIVMDPHPLYIRKDFAGPLKAVFTKEPNAAYRGFMTLKSASMSAIMFSPAMHGMVVYGKAIPSMVSAMGWKNNLKNIFTAGIYTGRLGWQSRQDHGLMNGLIKGGLVPMGGRGMNPDLPAIADGIKPGRSLMAKAMGSVFDLASPKAGDAARRAVDAAGHFWHDTLLWDRVGDLQVGMAVQMRNHFMDQGIDEYTATRIATHFANRYAGAMPQEAMSQAAHAVLNVAMFSKTFTMTNMGAMKDPFAGLPKEVRAQIRLHAYEAQKALGKTDIEAEDAAGKTLKQAQRTTRLKAAGVLMVDFAAMAAVTSLTQAYFQSQSGQQFMDDLKDRLARLGVKLKDNPMYMLPFVGHPFDAISSLSQTSDNPGGKEDRVRIGEDEHGNSYYMRLPFGKTVEELKSYMNVSTLTKKLGDKASPLVGSAVEAWHGKDFQDRSIYKPEDNWAKQIGLGVGHILKSQVPFDDMVALKHVLDGQHDQGDRVHLMGRDWTMDQAKLLGATTGLTIGKLTGGDTVAVMNEQNRKAQQNLHDVLPDVKDAIEQGDTDKARQLLIDAGQTPQEAVSRIRRLESPQRINGQSMRRFQQRATDEERERLERMRAR